MTEPGTQRPIRWPSSHGRIGRALVILHPRNTYPIGLVFSGLYSALLASLYSTLYGDSTPAPRRAYQESNR